MKTPTPGLVGPLISVDEFRRAYFGEARRPTRATVKRWVDSGTSEGVRLPGVIIENTYYIDSARVDDFFAVLQGRSRSAQPTKATGAASRAALAVEKLRVIHGVGRKYAD